MAFRRGNATHYNANLNIINPMYGSAEPTEDTFDQSNLDLFSNADFFDWEMGQSIPVAGPDSERAGHAKKMEAPVYSGGDNSLQSFDFNSFDLQGLDTFVLPANLNPANSASSSSSSSLQMPPSSTTSRPQQSQQQRPRNLAILPQPSHPSPSLTQGLSSNFASPVSPTNSLKRKSLALEQSPTQHSMEEASRAAAEEDKRRRNTAASARFRVKKKQREQALEQHSKDLESKVQELNTRVSTLESENKWLKDLLMEKHSSNEDFLKLIKTAPFPLSSLPRKDGTSDG